MPREVIHHGQRYILVKDPETGYEEAWDDEGDLIEIPGGARVQKVPGIRAKSPSFEVFWQKPQDPNILPIGEDPEGVVQFLMDVDREEILRLAKRFEEEPSMTATAVVTRAVSRHQINEAIRVLRRARSQAYGADE